MSIIKSIWNSTNGIIKQTIRVFDEEVPSRFLFIYITKENDSFASFIDFFYSNKSLLIVKNNLSFRKISNDLFE